MSIWSNVSFKANFFLLIFCLDELVTDANSMFQSSIVIVSLAICPFISVNVIYLGFFVLGAYYKYYAFIELFPL